MDLGSGLFYHLIHEKKLPRNCPHNHQQERRVLVGELIQRHKSKYVKDGRWADLSRRRDRLPKRLILRPVEGALNTRLENLYCNDSDNTND